MLSARRLLLAGQAVSLLGDGFAVLAVPLLILHLTHDPLAAGLGAAPRGVGYLLAGLPAGPIVDRVSPWPVLVVVDVVRAGVFVALPVLAWTGTARLWLVLALAFLAGTGTVFFDSAIAVGVKDLFRDEGLLRANSVLETATQTSQVAGPALVGVLTVIVGVEGALLLNALTFAVSVLSLTLIRRAVPPEPRVRARRGGLVRGLVADLREGLGFVVEFRPLLALTVVQTLVNLCLAVDTLIVLFARVTLALPVPVVSAVVAAGGGGGIAGAVMAAPLAARVRALPLISGGIAVVAGTFLVMGVTTSWWLLLLTYTVQVWAVTAISVVNRSTRQAWTPRELLGRVSAGTRTFFLTATPVGSAIAGLVTRASGGDPRPAFLGAGVLALAVVGTAWLTILRRYDAVLAGRGG